MGILGLDDVCGYLHLWDICNSGDIRGGSPSQKGTGFYTHGRHLLIGVRDRLKGFAKLTPCLLMNCTPSKKGLTGQSRVSFNVLYTVP